MLVVPDRQTDRQTLSPIELFWTAKKLKKKLKKRLKKVGKIGKKLGKS